MKIGSLGLLHLSQMVKSVSKPALMVLTLACAMGAMPPAAFARHHHHHSLRHMVRVHHVPQSSMVVDGKTGRILEAENEHALRHPASITKVMTLYLLFEEMDKGRFTLNSDLHVSMHAASQAPSKLGLEPGDTISVEDAIKAIVTRSANDVAVTIAENIGGTESHFAELMTQKAHSLGMSRTVYKNASGLPNDGQVTTAHDLTILGRAIQERFPKLYGYFQTHEFAYNGAIIRTHNHLLGRVEGVDGIKTGFTNASGFNLLTSVHRDNHYLIAVVLGGSTAHARDAKMAALIEDTIDKSSTGRTMVSVLTNRALDYTVPSGTSASAHGTKPELLLAEKTGDDSDEDTDDDLDNAQPKRLAEQKASVPESRGKSSGSVIASANEQGNPIPPAPLAPPRQNSEALNGAAQNVTALATPVSPAAATHPRTAVVSASPSSSPATASASAAATPGAAKALPDVHITRANSTVVLHWSRGAQGIGTAMDGDITASTGAHNAKTLQISPPDNTLSAPAQAPHPRVEDLATQVINKPGADWMVQIGATDDADKAQVLLARAKVIDRTGLGHAEPFTEKVQKGDTTLYRARFAGLDGDEAERVCLALKHEGFSCFATKN